MNVPPHVGPNETTERKICVALVDEALSWGYLITVSDGEKSADRDKILDAMFSTEEDILSFTDGGQDVGFIHLIYGNDEDVISDCVDSGQINRLCHSAMTRAGIQSFPA